LTIACAEPPLGRIGGGEKRSTRGPRAYSRASSSGSPRVSEQSERSERSEFRGVGHGCEHRSAVGALRRRSADISPGGGSAQAALPRRPWKSYRPVWLPRGGYRLASK